ncbi:LamB/YcsF family protein [Parapedobacter tibetensis]|uniref:LamB/YcsF family protein n=1 Tax=Parapedobacter tibetensis TaxID=2972951 RepID=UPI00214D18BF|nr:5-oxoprolinase subunit PxpA [Parapedobacter tibetensis]
MICIDLNCDMGETAGNQPGSPDEALLDYVSSANIACGFHAGDAQRMQLTVHAALTKGVAIGAHPGLPDLDGFGRQEIRVTANEVYQLTTYQIGALYGFVKAAGGKLHHVKPHGALYNMAARDADLAGGLVTALYDFDPKLILYALAGSEMIKAAQGKGIAVAAEGFSDRTYQADGSLTPRNHTDSLVTDVQEAIKQSIMLTKYQQVISVTNSVIFHQVDTMCIHGDTPYAAEFAQAIHGALVQEGIMIKAPSM